MRLRGCAQGSLGDKVNVYPEREWVLAAARGSAASVRPHLLSVVADEERVLHFLVVARGSARRVGHLAAAQARPAARAAQLSPRELAERVVEHDGLRRRLVLEPHLALRRARHGHDQVGGVGQDGVVGAPWVELQLVGALAELRLERVEERVAKVTKADRVATFAQVLCDLLHSTRVELGQVSLEVA
eukprot:6203612-Pleurochrysis_carterae.AAC.4